MANLSNLKPLPLWIRLSCETVEPYLVPFSENALDARTHARVTQHLSTCPSCQNEVQVLGEMADFFRANPPQTAAPAPNLWKNIEAQIQAETPERIAAFKSRPTSVPVPVPAAPARPGFDWGGFSRAFMATGGVMTAAVACVWVVLERLPVEPSSTTGARLAKATEAKADDTVTIALIQPRKKSVDASTGTAPVFKPVERTVALRPMVRVASASTRRALTLIRTQPVPAAPSVRPLHLAYNTAKADDFRPLYRVSETPLGTRSEAHFSVAFNSPQRQRNADADTAPESTGTDPLQRMATVLDNTLAQATVAAVAASLPSAEAEAEALNRDTNVARANVYAHAAPKNELADTVASAPVEQSLASTSRRPTQVAWLVEEDSRASGTRRSAGEAARDARRQQSLFSYGSR